MATNMFKRPLFQAPLSRLSCFKGEAIRYYRPMGLTPAYRPLGYSTVARTTFMRPPTISGLGKRHTLVKLDTVAQQNQLRLLSTSPKKLFNTLTKWQRRASLISAFGGGILLTIFIGPILLVTVGGIGAVFLWRNWRQIRGVQKEFSSVADGRIPNPLTNIGSMFASDQSQLTPALRKQAIERIKEEVEAPSSEISRYMSTNDSFNISFSDVQATSSSRSSATINGQHESKSYLDIEFTFTSDNDMKGFARARGSISGSQVNLEKTSLYWPQWDREMILPASLNSREKPRIIEGEFKDVD
ncbi:hypothetical protein K450DRAFT_261586 [Umbelopsis ramanniana AG]|uniref:Uncharacterized protein n=1 Tax=Umbelopsis ramanniana AG TaxID=1314678 RepID=A0AAD5E219_UMBRA|nr:uncharacterized protein K450DRAFT_261586 [Umbelopsis ramanniana AG]KAI8575467.1 hypothetical protein K450DRAFT_261586 [Umbelopsis ramanniana AG]